MLTRRVLWLVLLGVSSVLSDLQICQDPQNDFYAISIKGLPGQNGLKGPRGDPGEAGPNGTIGLPGSPGILGPFGDQGIRGPKGDKGQLQLGEIDKLKMILADYQLQAIELQVQADRQKKAFCSYGGGGFSETKIYISRGTKETYKVSKEKCQAAGGTLASPRSIEENEVLQEIRSWCRENAYLGINAIDPPHGFFKYPNGQKIVFTNWAPGQPDGHNRHEECVEMLSDGKWNDRNCEDAKPYICEF